MDYMAAHGRKRSRPAELVEGTRRVISVRMDYLPGDTRMAERLADPEQAYVSRYALGRDYHKLVRKRLQQLAERIQTVVGPFGFRAFVDSAPVLEKALAQQAGLGWIGKHTLLINRQAGSWFFLGELFVDLPLPRLSGHLPHRGHRRPAPAGCAPLHFLPDHRAQGLDSAGAAPADRQPGVRLRRLPAGMSLEPFRQADRGGGLPAAPRPGQQ